MKKGNKRNFNKKKRSSRRNKRKDASIKFIKELLEREIPESKTLAEIKGTSYVEFKIEDINFEDGFISVLNFRLVKRQSDIKKGFNNLKAEYIKHRKSIIKLKIIKNKIHPTMEFDCMIRDFYDLYNYNYKKKCTICNAWKYKEEFEDHKAQCKPIEPSPEPINPPSDPVEIIKPKHTPLPVAKPRRDDLQKICESIAKQINYERNAKEKSIGRIQMKKSDKLKVIWLYNDLPKTITIKYDLNGRPTTIQRDKRLRKIIPKTGTPVSKNNKIVTELLLSKRAGKSQFTLLNTATYENRQNNDAINVQVKPYITRKVIYWPSLKDLLEEIDLIKNIDLSGNISDRELIKFLMGSQVIKIENKEELFKDAKPFIRYAFTLRSQHLMAIQQESVKRGNVLNGITVVIDGGPGTGKTTALIQRIRYLTSPETLIGYYDDLDLDNKKFERLVKTDNENWVLFSPNGLHAEFLKDNLQNEGLEYSLSYIKVWRDHLKILARDYEFIEDVISFPENDIHTDNRYLEKINIDFANEMLKYFRNIFAKPFELEGIVHPDVKKIFDKFIPLKKDLKTANLDSLTLYHLNLYNLRKDLETLEEKQGHVLNQIHQNVLNKLSEENKKELIDFLKKSSPKEEITDAAPDSVLPITPIEESDFEIKPDKYYLDNLKSTIKRILIKKGKEVGSKKSKLSTRESKIFSSLSMDNLADESIFMSQSDEVLKGFGFVFNPFDTMWLNRINSQYGEFRKNHLAEMLNLQPEEKMPDDFQADEISFLISRINEYVIQFLGNISPNINKSHKYYDIYKLYKKNIIAADEVSDLNLFDIQCIYSLRDNEINSVTLCGDIMQRMTKDGISNWDQLKSIIPTINPIELKESYRQSPTLLRLASSIYKEITGIDPKYIPHLSEYAKEPKPLLFQNT
jgi:hypothetical protein